MDGHQSVQLLIDALTLDKNRIVLLAQVFFRAGVF
jgi:hypothetical protein